MESCRKKYNPYNGKKNNSMAAGMHIKHVIRRKVFWNSYHKYVTEDKEKNGGMMETFKTVLKFKKN